MHWVRKALTPFLSCSMTFVLIAALVGAGDDLLGGSRPCVSCYRRNNGYIVVDRHKVAFHFADVLAQDQDVVWTHRLQRVGW